MKWSLGRSSLPTMNFHFDQCNGPKTVRYTFSQKKKKKKKKKNSSEGYVVRRGPLDMEEWLFASRVKEFVQSAATRTAEGSNRDRHYSTTMQKQNFHPMLTSTVFDHGTAVPRRPYGSHRSEVFSRREIYLSTPFSIIVRDLSSDQERAENAVRFYTSRHNMLLPQLGCESPYYGCRVFASTNIGWKWDILVSWCNNRLKFLVDV